MPVISFTDGDFLAGKLLDKGNYPVQITEIDGPTASKSGKSVSFFVTIAVTAGKFMNKELRIALNTETENSSILGSMQWYPHNIFLKITAAIKKISLDELQKQGKDLDTDGLLNQPFEISADCVPNAETGELMNVITAFLPAGAGAEKTPW